MFSKTAFFLAFAAIAELALASPPACMLATINTVDEAWKIEKVCKTKNIVQDMVKACGGDAKEALSAFSDICNRQANVKISTDIPTSTTSIKPSGKPSGITNSTVSVTSFSSVVYTTATFDEDCSCTKTGVVTSVTPVLPSGIATSAGEAGPSGAAPTGTPSPTGPDVAQSTGAAGRLGVAMAAVVAGVGGLAVIL